ncbi:YeeE/YedE family protein [Methyloprofundus sedimenti]|uniref:YeeE/YedE family protein n=1 Tax=Methyloprofundus sedimenti TaxID=1420851 RepID=A0A1V8M5X9_9GAMM|nr:DUF6691 family protein [Methyloprofundus sedimenti]OQK16955.1 YeeE/YedE family protein [Methyloprofundus sedimenti]
MIINLIALLAGIIFGLGLALSQMIDPNKVLNFLDVTGDWDPSLAFVMIGALAVTILSFHFILKRSAPLLDSGFHVTKQVIINRPLLLGAGLFGIGWGMTGYCPGPAVASLGLFSVEGIVMVIAIYAGFFSQRWIANK